MMSSFFDTKKPIFENEKKCFCNRKGVRFHPTEEEIINHFLYHKINGTDSSVDRDVKQIDLLEWDPKDIPGYLRTSSGSDDDNKRWYFFNRPDFKYSNSRRTNRKTKGGFWKVTGKVRVIKVNKEEIGEKRSLVYYEKSCGLKQTKTDWIIDEFQAKSAIPAEAWMDFKRAVSAEQLLEATRSSNQNQETTQKWMDFKHSLSDEQLPVSTRSGNENQEATQEWMDFKHSLSDAELLVSTRSGNENQEATQEQMDFSNSFTDEELMLLENCFCNQNTALDLQCAWEDDVNVDPIPLADSFLKLDDWP